MGKGNSYVIQVIVGQPLTCLKRRYAPGTP